VGISKYTLYKYVKVDGTWRYCKAAYHDNGKIKPDIVFVNVKEVLVFSAYYSYDSTLHIQSVVCYAPVVWSATNRLSSTI
jgi:hypothetical protein